MDGVFARPYAPARANGGMSLLRRPTTGRVPPDALAWIRPNDFPAFRPPLGESHILIYSPDHDRTFAELTVPEVVRVIGLWRQVYTQLASRYPAIMTWETSGEAIGQTQRHPQ